MNWMEERKLERDLQQTVRLCGGIPCSTCILVVRRTEVPYRYWDLRKPIGHYCCHKPKTTKTYRMEEEGPKVSNIGGCVPTIHNNNRSAVIQVKSSRGATHSRSEHPDPNFFLPPPLRGLWRSEWVKAWRPVTVTGPSAGN